MSLTKEQCEEFWAIADTNKDGKLTVQELAKAARKYRPDLSDKDCVKMFCGIDNNDDKQISKEEFFNEMNGKQKRSETLMQLFKEYDTSGDGTLSQAELRKLIERCFKPEVVEQVLKDYIKYSDTDGDGSVSFAEFVEFFG